jgi:nucleotidyltransferase/DNA polymerase involved in DNA repair
MGTTLALEDVIMLADSLHQHADLEAAWQSYERRRQAELRRSPIIAVWPPWLSCPLLQAVARISVVNVVRARAAAAAAAICGRRHLARQVAGQRRETV